MKLGAVKPTNWDIPWIGKVERTETAVRESFGRLTSSPSGRLRERLFWFDGDNSLISVSEGSLDTFIKGLPYSGSTMVSHDLALLHLLAALLHDADFNDSHRWEKTFQAWKECIADEEYWASVLEAEMTGGFEPAATSEEIENMRQEALGLVANIVATLARDAMAQGHQDRFRRIVNVLEASGLPSGLITKFENETFGSREDSFAAKCAAIRSECNEKIQRDASAYSEENRAVCQAAMDRFASEIVPELPKLTNFAGANSDISRRARESAASLLISIGINYTWANEFITSEQIFKQAKGLVPADSIVNEKISEQLFILFAGKCADIRGECGAKIQRDESGVDSNRAACTKALAKFSSEIEPALYELTDYVGTDSEFSNRAREAAASLLVSIAIDYTWANEFITSEKILKQAQGFAPPGSKVTEKIEEQLFDVAKSAQRQRYPKGSTPIANTPEGRFEDLCTLTSSNCRDSIRRDDQSVSANRRFCQKALERFDTELKPELDKLLAMVGADSVPGLMAREAAALCLHSIAIDLTWANEFKIGEATLGEALALVPTKSSAARKIADSLEKFPRSKSAKSARPAPKPSPAPQRSAPPGAEAKPTARKRDWEKLEPITAAPSLGGINGFGFRLYGKTDIEPFDSTGRPDSFPKFSHLTTYYFTALFIPIFPICRYRVVDAGGNHYFFLMKAPLRTFDKWHLGISIAAVIGFFLMVNQESGHTTYTPSRSYSSTQQDKGTLATQIRTNKARIKELEGQLNVFDGELAEFKTAITPLRKEIKGYEAAIKNGIPFDHDAYELALDKHNGLAGQARPTISKREKAYKEYSQLIDTTNGLIDEYKK